MTDDVINKVRENVRRYRSFVSDDSPSVIVNISNNKRRRMVDVFQSYCAVSEVVESLSKSLSGIEKLVEMQCSLESTYNTLLEDDSLGDSDCAAILESIEERIELNKQRMADMLSAIHNEYGILTIIK